MGTTTVEDVLNHFGVKGMHWGVRNDRKKSSGSGKRSGTNGPPHPSTLSDDALKKHVARMELEKRYTDLAAGKHSKSKGEGAAFAKELGKNSVKIASATATSFAVGKALNKAFK